MRMFHSKHQKLILQCYPPGKAVDKKPNSSELSYLLYYASTRRIKLEKVASFLTKKTVSDSARNKAGNLQVTLSIISALVDKCLDDLNVFALYVCSILLSVLHTKDVSLWKSALTTFGVFCSKLDSTLFPGDLAFVQQFTLLSETFIYAQDHSVLNPNMLDWQMISLVACRHLSQCIGHNAKFGLKFINKIIPLYLKMIYSKNKIKDLERRLNSHNHHHGDALTKVVLSKSSRVLNAQIDEDFENDTLTSDDINEEAFRGVKNLFSSPTSSQITEVARVTIQSLHRGAGLRLALSLGVQVDPSWGTKFIELFTSWIPVQLRFITVNTLLEELTVLTNESTAANTNYDAQTQFANHIYGLVSSEINMIGLSISDINQQILELQLNLILYQSAFLDPGEVTQLSQVYSDCICHLSTHIYYFDQVPDSVQEILTKIDSALEYSYLEFDQVRGLRVPGEKIHELIVTLLTDITTIFSDLKKKPSSITRNRVNLEHWDVSLAILSPDTDFGNASLSARDSLANTSLIDSTSSVKRSSLSIGNMNEIQRKYLKVFGDFLTHEFSQSSSQSSTTSTSELLVGDVPRPKHLFTLISKTKKKSNDFDYNDILKHEVRNYKKPDAQQYISISDNFLAHFLTYVDKFFSHNDYPNIENVFLLTDILKSMLSIFGINFINNFVPFFYHWLLRINGTSSDFQQKHKFKDTIAIVLMYYCLKSLDDTYTENMEGYAQKSEFFSYLLYNIQYRKLNKLWMNGVDSHPEDDELINASKGHEKQDTSFKQIKKSFQDFVSGNIFLSMWINPEKVLILDVIKRNNKQNESMRDTTSQFQDALDSNSNGQAAHDNGRFLRVLTETSSPDTGSDFTDGYSVRHTHNNGLGLGLGNANDISSIHSEIVHNRAHARGGFLGGGDYSASIYTSDAKYITSPKVSDLKELIRDSRRDSVSIAPDAIGNGHTPRNDHFSTKHQANGKTPDLTVTNSAGNTSAATESVLSRQIVTTDVGSILGGLDSDDEFVV